MNNDDFYTILGIDRRATAAEIKERFRFLCHAYHPDKFATDTQRRFAEEHFKRVNEAYRVLSNSAARARYDSSRPTSSSPPPKNTSPPPHTTSQQASSPIPPILKPSSSSKIIAVCFVVVALAAGFALVKVAPSEADRR